MNKISKSLSLFIVLLIYAAAFSGGYAAYKLVPFDTPWSYLVADAAATVIVWAFGLLFHNASMYDPYWSVAPVVLVVCFVTGTHVFEAADALYIAVFSFWGVRLTLNWIAGWKGLSHQDWRYTMLRENNKALWPLTNFFGINMMPTILVFAGVLPAFFATRSAGSLTVLSVTGAAVCICAAALQIISDGQMRRFRKTPSNAGRNMATGLWKYSRHPNYLGEVSFWWGVYIMMLGQTPAFWWLIVAPVMMTLLFVFVSIPMMEQRLISAKSGYGAYKKSTSMLLILPRRKILYPFLDSDKNTSSLI